MPEPSTLEIGAAYIRVSTDDQTELSPDAQIRAIMDAAKADGFIIPSEYIFEEKKGISGRKADNRPEFQRMIAVAKSQRPRLSNGSTFGSFRALPAIRKKARSTKASSAKSVI